MLASLAAAVLAVATRTRATRPATVVSYMACDPNESGLPSGMTSAALEPEPAALAPSFELEETAREDRRAGAAPFDLMAEVQVARELGLLSDTSLAAFLAQVYYNGKQPQQALRILRLQGVQDPNQWTLLASAFESAGDIARQREALLAALKLSPGNAGLLADLGRIDPDLAMAELTRLLAAAPPPGDAYLRRAMAGILLRNGRPAEARAVIDGLLSQDPAHRETLWLLFGLHPARAIDHVERLMGTSSESGELRQMLVYFLIENEGILRAEEALHRLEGEGRSVGSEEWGTIAESWLDAEDAARAVSAFLRALDHEHGDPDDWVEELAELAPATLLLALERRVASDEARNDEYWGALADSYWAAGRQADARAAWERAMALDPDDEEWPERLRVLERGGDPYE